MARRAYKKPYRAKKKKPLLAKASFWRSVGVTAAAGGAFWVICFCPALEVREVNIEGAQKINSQDCSRLIEDEINKKIAFFDSRSILLFNLEQTKREILAKFPQVQDIRIVRQFPSKIYASVEERRGVAVFIDGGGRRFFVDMQGVAFESATDSGGIIEINDGRVAEAAAGSQVISKELLDGILRMKGQIDGTGKVAVTSATVATLERVNLLTSEGWYIYFNPLKDINDQLVKLNAVLADNTFQTKRQNLEYLDIRFTRIYLKEKSEADNQEAIDPSQEASITGNTESTENKKDTGNTDDSIRQ